MPVVKRVVGGGLAGGANARSVVPQISPPQLPKKKRYWVDILFWVAMGAAWLCASIFLIMWMRDGSASVVDSPLKQKVTYGSLIKLEHVKTGYRLHSHDIPYGSGSGQQSVTCFPDVNNANSYWMVKPESGNDARDGDTISSGTVIRLQHGGTKKWLHSHHHESPLSGNLEVSGFGGPDKSDTGDLWRLEIEENGDVWTRDQKVRLYHVDTSSYLHSHGKKYGSGAPGQQEVCGFKKKTPNSVWMAAEGIYLPQRLR